VSHMRLYPLLRAPYITATVSTEHRLTSPITAICRKARLGPPTPHSTAARRTRPAGGPLHAHAGTRAHAQKTQTTHTSAFRAASAVGAGEVELGAPGLSDDGVEVELVEATHDQVGAAKVLVLCVARRRDDAGDAGGLGGGEAVVGVLDGDAVLRRHAQLADREIVNLGVRLELGEGAGGENADVLCALLAHQVHDVPDGAIVGAGAYGELDAGGDCFVYNVVDAWPEGNLLGIYKIIEDLLLTRIYFCCHCKVEENQLVNTFKTLQKMCILTIQIHLVPSVSLPEF
jgi:hypothetical protein